jgi:hypothetical protein
MTVAAVELMPFLQAGGFDSPVIQYASVIALLILFAILRFVRR